VSAEDQFKLFHITQSLISTELIEVERSFGVELDASRVEDADAGHDEVYYPQFSAAVRKEAASMARHYETFYCLETSIRELVSTVLNSSVGSEWWAKAVPDGVKINVATNITREEEAGITLRSPEPIDYTTFGELATIIEHNWDLFADTFNNKKALVKILAGLNLLRGPIAHCCPLAEDEILRLRLAVRDWFRLME
jgi:hypothetical protein